jgi:hypothetical protein
MLTDDDLTRELGAAFRAETHALSYTGRRRPRRTAVMAVPVAAVTVAIAAVAVNATLGSGTTTPPSPAVAVPSSGPSTPAAAPRPVTAKFRFAGYTFTYQRAQGQTAPIVASMEPGPVPDGFTPVSAPNGAKAWVGKDPQNGDNAIYVQIADRNGGQLFSLHSPVWTQDELVDFFHHGTPETVPLVKE